MPNFFTNDKYHEKINETCSFHCRMILYDLLQINTIPTFRYLLIFITHYRITAKYLHVYFKYIHFSSRVKPQLCRTLFMDFLIIYLNNRHFVILYPACGYQGYKLKKKNVNMYLLFIYFRFFKTKEVITRYL